LEVGHRVLFRSVEIAVLPEFELTQAVEADQILPVRDAQRLEYREVLDNPREVQAVIGEEPIYYAIPVLIDETVIGEAHWSEGVLIVEEIFLVSMQQQSKVTLLILKRVIGECWCIWRGEEAAGDLGDGLILG
jgi:hypothetical protein